MNRIKSILAWFWADKKRIVILIILLAGIYFIFGRKKNNIPQYQTARVEKGTIISSISASGKVATTNIMEVKSGATGIIKKVYVKDGSVVVAGQKLAEITLDAAAAQKNAAAWASYLSAKNSVDAANVTFYTLQSAMFAANQKFINDAVHRNLATDDPTYIQENADWLASEAKYKNQQAVLSQSKAALGSSFLSYQETSPTIVAPVGGIFNNTGLVDGLSLSESVKLGTIINSSKPVIAVSLAEIDINKVKLNQKVTVTFDSIPDKTFTGKLVTIDKSGIVSSNVTSYPGLIQLDVTSNDILPNMASTANIILDSKSDVLVVPSGAIQNQNGAKFVRVLRNGQITQIEVETGLSSDTDTEIVSGVSEGDEVIIGTITGTANTSTGRSVFSGGFGGGGGTNFRTR